VRMRLAACALVLAGLSTGPSPALTAPRGIELIRSSPAADARLRSSPAEIRLWFSQAPEPTLSLVRLTGPGGRVDLPRPKAGDERDLTVPLQGTLAPGSYRVDWRASGGDADPARGSFAFEVLGR